eukprot:g3352.t1
MMFCLLLFLILPHISVASSFTVNGMSPHSCSYAGGGRVHVWGHNLSSKKKKKTGGELFKQSVRVAFNYENEPIDCDFLDYSSESKNIFCVPGRFQSNLDGHEGFSEPETTGTSSRFDVFRSSCKTKSRGQISVKIDDQGGVTGLTDTQGVIDGNCSQSKFQNHSKCSQKPELGHTPTVVAVEPRNARPGQVITVFGRTCIRDDWRRDPDTNEFLKPNMEEDEKGIGWGNRSVIGVKKLLRVRVGDFVCETLKPQKPQEDNDEEESSDEEESKTLLDSLPDDDRNAPMYYRSESIWERKYKWHCSSPKSWFQCRIPDGIPQGLYKISFETIQGHSVTPIEGFHWFPDHAKFGYHVNVISNKKKIAAVTSISTLADDKHLRVRGRDLDHPTLSVSWGGLPCKVTNVTSSELLCEKDTSYPNPQKAVASKLGPFGLLRERWVFFSPENPKVPAEGEAWNDALSLGTSKYTRPEEIMDKLYDRQDSEKLDNNWTTKKVTTILPGLSAPHPYDSSHAYLDRFENLKLGVQGNGRSAVFQRVSGVINPIRDGKWRFLLSHNAGQFLTIRVGPGETTADAASAAFDGLRGSEGGWSLHEMTHHSMDDTPTHWFTVERKKFYMVEVLLKHNNHHHRYWGDFSIKVDFSYGDNDFGGITTIEENAGSPTKAPRRARSGLYTLRTSVVPEEEIVIDVPDSGAHKRFNLQLWNGQQVALLPSVVSPDEMNFLSFRAAIRKSLSWASCDALPNDSYYEPLQPTYSHDRHPFDVKHRWALYSSTEHFTDLTNHSGMMATWRDAAGYAGASMDYSTSYCGASSQKFDLDKLAPGRIIAPPYAIYPQAAHKYLNFAYKISPNSRASLLLRLIHGKNQKLTCAILLTHAQNPNGVTANAACLDLRSVISADGNWHHVSIDWRTALAGGQYAVDGHNSPETALFPDGIQVLVRSIGVGAQIFLSGCPTAQAAADEHGLTPVVNADDLKGQMWIDAVSFTKEAFTPNRVVVDKSKLGGLVEGLSAVTNIQVSATRDETAKSTKLNIKLARVSHCLDSGSHSTLLSPLAPTISMIDGGNQNLSLPTATVKTRRADNEGNARGTGDLTISTIHRRVDGGVKKNFPTDTTISDVVNATSEDVRLNFRNSLFPSNVSFPTRPVEVADSVDIFDSCSVKARQIFVAHASDLSSPQAFYYEYGQHWNHQKWHARARPGAKESKSQHAQPAIGLKVNANSTNGSVAELIPQDGSRRNAGYARLGGAARDLNIHIYDAPVDMKLAVVRTATEHLPCIVSPFRLGPENWDGTWLSGDVTCHLAPKEKADTSKESTTTSTVQNTGTRRLSEKKDKLLSGHLKYPGEGTWAERPGVTGSHPLIMGLDELGKLSTAVPTVLKNVEYSKILNASEEERSHSGDLWKGLRRKLSTGTVADQEDTPTPIDHGLSTESIYELPTGQGRWSDASTWGNNPAPTKESTDVVFVPAGFHLTIDVPNIYIRVWIIEGTLDFDPTMDVHMEGEFIIVNGDDAHFTIGTAASPWPSNKKAKITMHGHWRSLGLPKFGVKVIAVTSGRLTFYGAPVEPWTLLEETAEKDASEIVVQGDMTANGWAVDSRIAIAATGYGSERSCRMDRKDSCQSEERIITAIVKDSSNTRITLNKPLLYKHWGESTPIPGAPVGKAQTIERRAEVILLTRSIQVTGTDVEAFGAHTMMLSGQMILDYVEFTKVGQAFQLGRYAVHYHTPKQQLFKDAVGTCNVNNACDDQPVGTRCRNTKNQTMTCCDGQTVWKHCPNGKCWLNNATSCPNATEPPNPALQGAHQSQSRTRGCSMHHSFNRALTSHATFNLQIERNVAYNIMGHAFFVEDGVEQDNIFKENVAMLIHRSFSLLNTDQTPACFWITNANNKFVGNRAAGSHTFGFWFDPPGSPTGPSSDTLQGPLRLKSVPSRNMPVGEFQSNVAHSNGSQGVWIDVIDAKQGGTGKRLNMIMKDTVVWNNGAAGIGVVTGVGHLHLIDTVAMGNPTQIQHGAAALHADCWATKDNGWNGHLVEGSLLLGDPDRNTRALGLPHAAFVSFKDTLISNFKSKGRRIVEAIHSCPSCKPYKGGMEIRFYATHFLDSDVTQTGLAQPRVFWLGYMSNIIRDMDGTFTMPNGSFSLEQTTDGSWIHSLRNAGKANWNSVGELGHFPPEYCSKNDLINGVLCDAKSVSMRELQFRRVDPMTGISLNLKTADDRKAPNSAFYHYDAEGRRFNWHHTLVMTKPGVTPIPHTIVFNMESWQIDDIDGWYAEIRELRKDEVTMLHFPTLRNPYRYMIATGENKPINNYDQATQAFDKNVELQATNEMGDYLYKPAEEFRDFNIKPEPGSLEIMVSGNLGDNFNAHWSKNLKAWQDGTTDAIPICTTGGCNASYKAKLPMKRVDCAPNDKRRCLPTGKPQNCFNGDPFPEGDPVHREFKWCDVVDGVWNPPKFGDDVLIKAGWTVILDGDCLETQTVRHLDVYGSLLLRDPGAGKVVKLKAQTIHVAFGIGYLEAGSIDDPITDGHVRIELYGNRFSTARFGYGLETKYIAVLGTLSLVGATPGDKQNVSEKVKDESIYTWANLQSDAPAGTNEIRVELSMLNNWKVDDVLRVGGGSIMQTKADWDQAEQCVVASIVKEGNVAKINCKTTFKYTHTGPTQKGGVTFDGVPVTLESSQGMHVAVVGMEDELKALEEHHYGAVVAILAAKTKKGMSRTQQRDLWGVVNGDKTKYQLAMEAENWSPPPECARKQGSAVIVGVGFDHCGQRHAKGRACLSFRAGFGGTFNVEKAKEAQGGSAAFVYHNTFSNGYNYAVMAQGDGISVVDNGITNMYHGGMKIAGMKNQVSNNAAIHLMDNITNWFHDMGAVGFGLDGTGTWKNNAVANCEYTAFKLSGRAAEELVDYSQFQSAEEELDAKFCNDELCEDTSVTTDEPKKSELVENNFRAFGAMIGATLGSKFADEQREIYRIPSRAYPDGIVCPEFRNIQARGMWLYGIQGNGGNCRRVRRAKLWDTGTGITFWMSNGGAGGPDVRDSARSAHVHITDTVIVGDSRRCRNDGIAFPNFYRRTEPFRPDQGVGTPSRFGGVVLENVTFVDFGDCNRNQVEVIGTSSTLLKDVDASQTEIEIKDFSALAGSAIGSYLRIENEILLIVEVKKQKFTVTRATNNTVAASHMAGAVVELVDVNLDVNVGTPKRMNFALVNSMSRCRYKWVYEDVSNPVVVKGLTFINTPENNRLYMVPASRGRIQRSTPFQWSCAQMYCDGHRNTFLIDRDGSLIGNSSGTIIPVNEIGWFDKLAYVDPLGRETLEYLIPYTAQFQTDGTRLQMQGTNGVYDLPGHLRDNCTHMSSWNAYKCPQHQHRQIIFESADADSTTRRLGPTSVLVQKGKTGKRFMSLYTGPAAYQISWSGKVSRAVTVWATGHLGATHTVHHSSTNPTVTRVTMVDATPEDGAVHVKMFFGTANRVDLYVDGKLVPPLTLVAFDNPDTPDLSSDGTLSSQPHGANFYDRLNGYEEFVLRGPQTVHLRVSNMVVLKQKLTITEDEFFIPGLKGLVKNVALLLGIPEKRIQVAGVGDYTKALEKAEEMKNGVSGNKRRVLTGEIPVELVITEDERQNIARRSNGSLDVLAEQAEYHKSAVELQELAQKVMDSDSSSLSSGTQLNLLADTLEVTHQPYNPVPGWTCDTKLYNDGECDCDCGRMDPDCERKTATENGDTTTYVAFAPRNCPTSQSVTVPTGVRQFCVEGKNIECDIAGLDPEIDLCTEWPCETAPTTEFQTTLDKATKAAFFCKPKVNNAGGGFDSTGHCAMTLLDSSDMLLAKTTIADKNTQLCTANDKASIQTACTCGDTTTCGVGKFCYKLNANDAKESCLDNGVTVNNTGNTSGNGGGGGGGSLTNANANCVLGPKPEAKNCTSSCKAVTQSIVTAATGNGTCEPAVYTCKEGDGQCILKDAPAHFARHDDYDCDASVNFIHGVSYHQISVTDGCKNVNGQDVCNANPKYVPEFSSSNSTDGAVEYCKVTCNDAAKFKALSGLGDASSACSPCTGFFFQRHTNGHEICGFYTFDLNNEKLDKVGHGHAQGSRLCVKRKIDIQITKAALTDAVRQTGALHDVIKYIIDDGLGWNGCGANDPFWIDNTIASFHYDVANIPSTYRSLEDMVKNVEQWFEKQHIVSKKTSMRSGRRLAGEAFISSLGTCMNHQCANSSLKSTPPVYCKGACCSDDECCTSGSKVPPLTCQGAVVGGSNATTPPNTGESTPTSPPNTGESTPTTPPNTGESTPTTPPNTGESTPTPTPSSPAVPPTTNPSGPSLTKDKPSACTDDKNCNNRGVAETSGNGSCICKCISGWKGTHCDEKTVDDDVKLKHASVSSAITCGVLPLLSVLILFLLG